MLKAKSVPFLAAQTATGLLQSESHCLIQFALGIPCCKHICSSMHLSGSSHMLDPELPGHVRGTGQQESYKSQQGQMPSPAPRKENRLCNNPGQ